MPAYDYRCNACGRRLQLFYKSYREYDSAMANGLNRCPHCGSADLTSVIGRVSVAKGTSHDFTKMSSDEMLNVLEGGDPREVGRMIHEVGGDAALDDPVMDDAAKRLMKGESVEKVEADVSAAASTTAE
jgi:putative FmdB family regulatory protein